MKIAGVANGQIKKKKKKFIDTLTETNFLFELLVTSTISTQKIIAKTKLTQH